MDEDWQPPTEAEMKVIEASRERSNKISKLMGSYLLKGYKMLASTCSVCETIELQDRQGNLYCVACSEVDSNENAKDNPVFSEAAASRQIAESQYAGQSDASVLITAINPASQISGTSTRPKYTVSDLVQEQQARKATSAPMVFSDLSSLTDVALTRNAEQSSVSVGVQRELDALEVKEVCHQAILELQQKIIWAAQELHSTKDTSSTLEYCQVLKSSAEAISALKHAAV